MLHSLKRVLWLLLFTATAQCSFGFSLTGTYEVYQTQVIGYELPGVDFSRALGSGYGGPKNVDSEFRYNIPVLYYSFDESFQGYFGAKGVDAIEQAVAILNNLTNLSSYSADLSEFPLNPLRYNFRAQALTLLDLKTAALHWMLEDLALNDPDRFVWTLRGRGPIPGLSCPFMEYSVIMRNYDPISNVYSPYVNGTLYSYVIVEICSGNNPLALARTFPVDPRAPQGTALASRRGYLNHGSFFTGLSRDDVAGLRYLFRTNNMNVEAVSSDSLQIRTNFVSQLLVTSNLATFAAQSITNDAAALATLYPGLIITGTTNFFTNVVTTNFIAYFTNLPFSTVASLKLVTNYTTNAETRFIHTFANVVTNEFFPRSYVTVIDTSVTNSKGFMQVGVLVTNTTITTKLVNNMVNGDFYIVPTNLCGYQVIGEQLKSLIPVTNTVPALTNIPGVTNIIGQDFSRDIVTYFTNHSLIVYPIECVTNSIAKRQGIDRLQLIRTTVDPVTGRFVTPITNFYTLTAENPTNFQRMTQTFRRIVTSPDWTFRAEEISGSPGFDFGEEIGFRTVPRFIVTTNQGSADVFGPGIIFGPINFDFNKVGPLIQHVYSTNAFLNGLSQRDGRTNYVWGSYDGTTNAPTVYPDGTSITDLENQLFFSVVSSTLPDGQVGLPYTTQLLVMGGDPPYGWTLNASSAGLPDGLSLSADGVISGTPTTDGIYDFTVDVTESGGRTITADLVITITP